MPLDITRLKNNLIPIMDDYDNIQYTDKETAREDFATKLATVLITEIRLATISVTGVQTGAGLASGTLT